MDQRLADFVLQRAELEGKLAAMAQECGQLRSHIQHCEEERAELERSNAAWTTWYDDQAKRVEEETMRVAELDQRLADVVLQRDELKGKFAGIAQECDRWVQDVTQLRSQIQHCDEERADLERSCAAWSARYDEQAERVEEETMRVAELQRQLDASQLRADSENEAAAQLHRNVEAAALKLNVETHEDAEYKKIKKNVPPFFMTRGGKI